MDNHSGAQLSDLAERDGRLVASGSAALPDVQPATRAPAQPPTAWLAHAIAAAVDSSTADIVYAASSERRAEEIGRALRAFAPRVEVLVLPAWDCLPYDRASPSRESMGRRMAVLARLAEPADAPRVLLAPVEALLQRTPPDDVLRLGFLTLRVGETLDRNAMEAFARTAGYVTDDRIDEPGEIALHGSVVDIFPAAAEAPVRISLGEADEIVEIKRYDPLTQRTDEPQDEVLVGPASEVLLDADAEADREPGLEHHAAEVYGQLTTVLERLPGALLAWDPRAAERAADFQAQVREAWDARTMLGEGRASPPDALYLPEPFEELISSHARVKLPGRGGASVTNFALERNPGRAFSNFVARRLAAGARVVVTGLEHELRPLKRALKRGLDLAPAPVESWAAVVSADAGRLLAFEADLEAGFELEDLCVIAAADVLGGRVARGGDSGGGLLAEPDLRFGDVVIHEDHGLGVLTGLKPVEVGAETREVLRLEYHGGAALLAPIEEMGKVWRYGAEPEAVTLDRLHTEAWSKRRAELSREIDRTAADLVELARRRQQAAAPVLEAPRAEYARFAARFPYPETPDQAAAITAVLDDLASGRPMRRLVCGDVGFGKTEVALRAAAVAALSGKQVAVVAPTTVLARQHFETFRRRFAGFGIEVGRLSRLVPDAEARATKAGLADGTIQVVVGTHAVAASDVCFADLGLVIIDEEQRFGAKLKSALEALAPDAHRLTLTATPIPRTLQLALVGVGGVSVIATPPARRRPIRTFLAPFDAALVRTALLRERRRGGQSFVVAPRIEDLEPLSEQLRELVPELGVRMAHGGLPPAEVDDVMVAFASGEGDVLLATNIIESGLDVPRANTILVTRAELFGLAQLHQLRGRVGRGRAQGVAYLLHDAETPLAERTRARLATLEAYDRLGAGLAISARDLEIRGAGDLVGEDQAGHVRLIGTALYQQLLARAVRMARGEGEGVEWTPDLNLGPAGALSETYVPDPVVRLNLYARLARMEEAEEVERFVEELEDRFGPPPAETLHLLEHARIRALARAVGVCRVDLGPKACALTEAGGVRLTGKGLERKGDRLLARDIHGITEVRQLLERLRPS